MKYLVLVSSIVLLGFASPVQAQGLPGTERLHPSPQGGTSAGGPLLPGKSDSARWAFLKSHEEELIGLPKSKVVSLFGQGGKGFDDKELVYQITEANNGKSSKIAYLELRIKFVNGLSSEYCISEVLR